MNLNYDFDKGDLLDSVGVARATSFAQRVAGTLGVFGAGMLVGAGIAFLTSPKSGPGMREDLRERLRRAPQDLKHAIGSVTGPATVEADTAPI